MLDHDNLDEYREPLLYDSENRAFDPDGPFYQEMAGRIDGAVLELGCGTGRVTLPLAAQGMDITGLDLAPAMIERAREKDAEGQVRWVAADARTFDLGRLFDLVFFSGGTFMHLLTRADQQAGLTRVREHLADGGTLVVDAIFPKPAMLGTVSEEEEWETYEDLLGRTVRLSGVEHYDHLNQLKHETAFRRWTGDDGEEKLARAPLVQRYCYPQELETLLVYNGFDVVERYGGWDRSPLTGESDYLIFVCQGK